MKPDGSESTSVRMQLGALALVLALLVPALITEAQQAANDARVGVLYPGSADYWAPGGPMAHIPQALREGLAKLGYVDGQNLAIEFRAAEGEVDRLRDLAVELIERRVKVLLVTGPTALKAARTVTATVPIVAIDLETDPVAAGYVTSLARPGGNVTGVFLDQAELSGKWLDLIREAVPGLSRVAVLRDAATPLHQLHAIQAAAKKLAVNPQTLEIRRVQEIEGAFARAASSRAQAVVMLSSPLVSRHGAELAAAATARRLPTISMFRENVAAGCLMGYGPSLADAWRRLGSFAGRVLKGAKAAEMPVERPDRFEFVVNLKTAKTLGLTLPPSLLLRADQTIE
jgi:putative tryptophan/tyrosine transport system substrate-binding protein